ncbi:2,3-bisphosphoglycerate-dependent phosphoglycerate mutase [Candidatus Woesearchaeota archaeon]|nr:MAG: 2,3-bisphosphoglycerate-dependent phosphoglycerate mutase [Candidatus Woesearchaeota archaeon]
MSYLILVRHGESRWNIANRFTGWVDVPLSENGIYEAMMAAKRLEGLRFDIAFTSTLMRAIETLLIILAKQDYTGVFVHSAGKGRQWSRHTTLGRKEIPVYCDEALNERYYGRLQGMNKDAARRKFGKQQVFIWRRSYDVRPPGGECLHDTYKRAVPYFQRKIMPHVRRGKNVLVSAHGNSLRAIIKYLDKISDEQIPHLELPTGKPVLYKWSRGKLVREKEHAFTRPIHWSAPAHHKQQVHKK